MTTDTVAQSVLFPDLVDRPLVAAFTENRREFEGAWYGDHRPDAGSLERFEQNVRFLVRKDAA